MAEEFETGGMFAPAPAPADSEPVQDSPPVPELSAAVQRFQSCRWRKAAENGTPDHCTHRDVQPMAGTTGFEAEAWCPECTSYKIRRNPRKPAPRPPMDRSYY
jgi:hypothetical protein